MALAPFLWVETAQAGPRGGLMRPATPSIGTLITPDISGSASAVRADRAMLDLEDLNEDGRRLRPLSTVPAPVDYRGPAKRPRDERADGAGAALPERPPRG